MIAVDTNLLVYAHRRDSQWHPAASACLSRLAASGLPWAIPWPCIYEFYSVVTHPRIYAPPTSSEQAVAQLDAWFEAPELTLLAEEVQHWVTLKEQLVRARVTGPLAHDAKIAALCLTNGISELWTADRDFGRFPTLSTKNPLIDSE